MTRHIKGTYQVPVVSLSQWAERYRHKHPPVGQASFDMDNCLIKSEDAHDMAHARLLQDVLALQHVQGQEWLDVWEQFAVGGGRYGFQGGCFHRAETIVVQSILERVAKIQHHEPERRGRSEITYQQYIREKTELMQRKIRGKEWVLEEVEGARQLVERVSRNTATGLTTGSVHEIAEAMLVNMGLREKFQVVVTATDLLPTTPHGKPKPGKPNPWAYGKTFTCLPKRDGLRIVFEDNLATAVRATQVADLAFLLPFRRSNSTEQPISVEAATSAANDLARLHKIRPRGQVVLAETFDGGWHNVREALEPLLQ